MLTRKRIISLFLSLVMIFSIFPITDISAFASESVVDYLTYEIDGGEVTITGCDSSISGDVTIPDTIEGYPVTVIGDYAFYDCNRLVSVTMPESVITIGYYAFYYCEDLESVMLGNNVTAIGYEAFYNCDNLKIVTIPENVTTIGESAFESCDNLRSVIIPDSVTTIGQRAFACSYALESITVDENNEYYSNDEYGVLFNKDKTELIQYPIGNSRTEYTIPDSVTTIGYLAFGYCENLENITISDSVTTIDTCAFMDCASIKNVTVPASVAIIGYNSFGYCYELESITILNPECEIYDFTHTIYSYAKIYGYSNSTAQAYAEKYNREFRYICDHEKEVVVTPPTCTEDGYTTYSCSECGYSYEDDFVPVQHSYSEETGICTGCGKNLFFYEINGGEVTITGCDSSISGDVTIPSIIEGYPVTVIESWAFEYCENLESIVIPDGVRTIWRHVFYGCDNLAMVTIPASVTELYYDTFNNCSGLEEIIVDENNEYYSSDEYGVLFNKDKTELIKYPESNSRTEYTTPDSVTVIGKYAFADSENLINVVMNNGVTVIELGAFESCYNLTNVTIPYGVTTIGENAFHTCNLESVIIPDSVTEIGYSAFIHCENLKSVELSANLTTIKNYTFCYCESLESITIPESVITIGFSAFENCTSLTEVIIPEGVESIANYVFANCESLSSITIPESVITIGSSAFENCASLESITVAADNEYYSNDEYGVLFNKDKTEFIYYPKGNSRTEYTIPDSVTTISDGAVTDCDSLVSVTIGNSVTIIGDSAFYGCDNLASVTIGNSVTTIDYYAFAHCHSLERVTIPDSVTTIGDSAFYGCDSLASVTILNPDCSIYDYSDTIDSGATIYGYPGSTAYEYAQKYAREFVSLCDHETEVVVTPPTCTQQGYTTSSCSECGYSVKSDYTAATGHIDENSDGCCDTCGNSMYYVINAGQTINVDIVSGTVTLVKFVPQESGSYRFYSSAYDDTYGYLYDANKNQLAYNDDSGDGGNFSITYSLTAGETYYFGCKYYSDYDSGSFDVSLEKIADEPVNPDPGPGDDVSTQFHFTAGEAWVGEEVTITLSATGMVGLSSADLIFNYSEEYLEFVSIRKLGNASLAVGDKFDTGLVSWSFFWSSYATSDQDICQITFRVLKAGTSPVIVTCDSWEGTPRPENASISITGIEQGGHTNHSWSGWTRTKNPTCTAAGTERRTCSGCDTTETRNVNKLGHSYSTNWTVDKAATCTAAGSKSHHCTRSGCTAKKDVTTTPANGHKWGNWTAVKAATCTAAGTEKRTCSVCKTAENRNVNAKGHSWGEWTIDVESTCKTQGSKSRICTACKAESGATVIDVVDHKLQHVVVDSTCTVAGVEYDICHYCEEVFNYTTLPVAPHTWGEPEVTDPSCTESGVVKKVCTVCNAESSAEGEPSKEHTWSEWTVANLPSCDKTGLSKRVCADCAIEETKEIEALGHDFAEEWTVDTPATCDNAGSESRHCYACDATVDAKEIPAIGHSWGEWAVTTAPTYINEGEETRVCANCKGEEKKSIEKLVATKETVNEDTGISISFGDNTYEKDITVEVKPVFDGSSYQLINNQIGNFAASIFDISTYVDDEKVQPSGMVLVKMPIPEGYNPETLVIYYLPNDGSAPEKMNCYVDGNYVCFETTHFSEYAIIDESLKAEDVVKFVKGDVNNDGKVTAADARLALRISAGLDSVDNLSAPIAAVDVTGDGKITASDARKILRHSAGIEPIPEE